MQWLFDDARCVSILIASELNEVGSACKCIHTDQRLSFKFAGDLGLQAADL